MLIPNCKILHKKSVVDISTQSTYMKSALKIVIKRTKNIKSVIIKKYEKFIKSRILKPICILLLHLALSGIEFFFTL